MAPVPGVCPKALTAKASKHITQTAELSRKDLVINWISLKSLSEELV
jgi:hypothetical protein